MKINNNEVLFNRTFNISQKLERLINGFSFPTDPKDGIKDVKIKDITVVPPCESYDFSLAIHDNKKAIFEMIKAKNISLSCIGIKEISLDVIFYDGFLGKRKNEVPVKLKYFSQNSTTTKNPIINKYLESWGLVKARSAC